MRAWTTRRDSGRSGSSNPAPTRSSQPTKVSGGSLSKSREARRTISRASLRNWIEIVAPAGEVVQVDTAQHPVQRVSVDAVVDSRSRSSVRRTISVPPTGRGRLLGTVEVQAPRPPVTPVDEQCAHVVARRWFRIVWTPARQWRRVPGPPSPGARTGSGRRFGQRCRIRDRHRPSRCRGDGGVAESLPPLIVGGGAGAIARFSARSFSGVAASAFTRIRPSCSLTPRTTQSASGGCAPGRRTGLRSRVEVEDHRFGGDGPRGGWAQFRNSTSLGVLTHTRTDPHLCRHCRPPIRTLRNRRRCPGRAAGKPDPVVTALYLRGTRLPRRSRPTTTRPPAQSK